MTKEIIKRKVFLTTEGHFKTQPKGRQIMANTITKKIVKSTAKETNTLMSIVKGIKDLDTLSAAVKMATGEDLNQLIDGLSPEQYDMLVDYMAGVDAELAELDRKAKEKEKAVTHIRSFMLTAMERKNMKNIVTAQKNLAEVQAGRAVSEFTVTVAEFMQIARDAGHSADIDRMVSIKKTAAEEFLGKALVNKITKQHKEEWSKVKFTKL